MNSKYPAVLFNKNQTVFISVLLLISLIVCGANSAAYADDGKVYPGAMCVRYSGPAASYSTFGHVANGASAESNQRLSVVCPVIHDSINSNVNSGSLRVSDRNDDSNDDSIRCRLYSYIRSNAQYFFERSSFMTSVGGDPEILSFNGDLDTGPSDHYFYRCGIPPRDNNTNLTSFISSYRVDEHN